MGEYYPSLSELQQLSNENKRGLTKNISQIVPGFLTRTDKGDIDEVLNKLNELNVEGKHDGLISRLKSVSDLSPKLYNEFLENPNSIGNWFDKIVQANKGSKNPFKLPETLIWTLPIEVAQFIRIEYTETTQKSKDLFNNMVYNFFNLSDEKEYFIKTGTFSSKFEFRNAHILKGEAKQMGEYFQVINNFSMTVGAAHSVELCVREYIDDKENNPTIYSGMPLRTEFRAFVDFDNGEIIGVVPYWNPIVMKKVLGNEFAPATIRKDYNTYCRHEDKLMADYNNYLPIVKSKLKTIMPFVKLKGKYSIDVMKNGNDFYLIDMATMESSALTDLL